MKRIKLSVWSIMVLCLSLALVSCGDDDHKNDHHGMRTGIHKIVVEQSGNTEDFEVNLVFGATNVNGPARLYDENGEYLGDSYSVGKMKSNRVSCQTGQDGLFRLDNKYFRGIGKTVKSNYYRLRKWRRNQSARKRIHHSRRDSDGKLQSFDHECGMNFIPSLSINEASSHSKMRGCFVLKGDTDSHLTDVSHNPNP